MKLLRMLKKWRIALLCSVIYLLYFGQRKTMGLLFVAFLERYRASREQVSLAIMLRFIVFNICGPLVGFLGSKFGIKSVTLYGCLFSSISLAACFYAEDIIFITVCFGILVGICEAMAIHLLPSLIHFYFKTKKAVAFGIVFVGPCIGGFLFSPLYKTLLDTYGTSGTFLILGALTLNSVPAALLLVNPATKNKTHEEGKPNIELEFKDENKRSIAASISDSRDVCVQEARNNAKACIATQDTLIDSKYFPINIVPITKSAKVKVRTSEERLENVGDNYELDSERNESLFSESGTLKKSLLHPSEISKLMDESSVKTFRSRSLDSNTQNEINDELKVHPNKTTNTNNSIWKVFSVLYDPLFILVSFVTSSHMFIMVTMIMIIVDFAMDKGLSVDQSVYLLMCVAISDMVGRLSFGWVTDRGHMSVTNFAAIFYFGTGLCYTGFAVATDFFVVMLTVTAGGVCMGNLMTVSPILMSKYCAEEKNTMALASRYIFMVPFTIVTVPLIGFFRETLGSYVWMFYVFDFICILCCIILLLIPSILRYRNRNVIQKGRKY